MTNEATNYYVDFTTKYLPDLFRYVVPIISEDEDRHECLGTGVFVNAGGRHFVASARHCIERNPRVVVGYEFYMENRKIVPNQTVKILGRRLHDSLDIGFFEIAGVTANEFAELQQNQLSDERIVTGTVHVVGHPVCMANLDMKSREMIITKSAFGTDLIEETDDFLKFHYPKEGVRFNRQLNEWERGPFPITPKGFSGGACFGVCHTVRSGLEMIDYRLLGIQYEWHPGERWVKVVPIRRWCELAGLDFIKSASTHC